MPEELRLSDELAACEARLAAQALPPSAINRDELLFCAGWAAGEANVAGSSRLGGRRELRLQSHFLTAALAASVAVVATLQLAKNQAPASSPQSSIQLAAPSPAAAEDETSAVAEVSSPSAVDLFMVRFDHDRSQPLAASLLGLQSRRQGFSSQNENTAPGGDEADVVPAATPSMKAWGRAIEGETI